MGQTLCHSNIAAILSQYFSTRKEYILFLKLYFYAGFSDDFAILQEYLYNIYEHWKNVPVCPLIVGAILPQCCFDIFTTFPLRGNSLMYFGNWGNITPTISGQTGTFFQCSYILYKYSCNIAKSSEKSAEKYNYEINIPFVLLNVG